MQSGPHGVVAGWLIRCTGNVLFFQVSTVPKYSFQGLQFYCHKVHFLHVVQFTKLQINKAPIEKSVKVHTKNRTWREKFSYVTFFRSWIQNRPAVFPFNLKSRQKRTWTVPRETQALRFISMNPPEMLYLLTSWLCWYGNEITWPPHFPPILSADFFIDLHPRNV